MQPVLSGLIRVSLLPGLLLLVLSVKALANEQKILVLGDSISAAYGMSLEQGWVARLASRLEPGFTVVNASISGETTEGGLRRLPPLLQTHQPDLVIIELGGNDGLRGYPLKTLRENLAGMVDLSQQSGARVILVPMEIPPNYGTRYTEGFRLAYQSVAEATDSTLAPFILDGVATRPRLMQPDGIHPTVEAQPLLLENMLPTVESVLADL
jgi:acyl-CoA thioesterase-1